MFWKRIIIAGADLLQFTCPDCGAKSFSSKDKQGFIAACGDCGFYSREEPTPEEYYDAPLEVRVPRSGSRSGMGKKYSRTAIFKRDNYTCQYCGWKQVVTTNLSSSLQVHHILPVARGGSHHPSNLVTACKKCHKHMGTRHCPPKTGEEE